MSNLLWSDKVNETLAELSGISKNNSTLKIKTPTEVVMEKIHHEIEARLPRGLPQQSHGSDRFGYLCGYPVEDLVGTLPLSEQHAALMEIMKMANLSGGVGGGGGGAGVLGQQPFAIPPGANNPAPLYNYNHEHMLCMRMRWRNVHDSPFENVYVYAAVGRKVFITIITKDMKAVTLDVDDDGLYPSDHLIAQIRTLGG